MMNVAFTLSFALAALGWLLFGLISLRTRVYPRAAVVVLTVGAALTLVPLPGGQVVFEVAVAGFDAPVPKRSSRDDPSA